MSALTRSSLLQLLPTPLPAARIDLARLVVHCLLRADKGAISCPRFGACNLQRLYVRDIFRVKVRESELCKVLTTLVTK